MNTARDYPSAPAGLAKRTPPPGILVTTAKPDGRKIRRHYYGDENATAKFEHTAKLHEIENHDLTSGADDRLRKRPGLADNASPGTHSLHAFGHTSCQRRCASSGLGGRKPVWTNSHIVPVKRAWSVQSSESRVESGRKNQFVGVNEMVPAALAFTWLLCKAQPKGTVIVGSASFLARHRRRAQQSLGAGRRIQ